MSDSAPIDASLSVVEAAAPSTDASSTDSSNSVLVEQVAAVLAQHADAPALGAQVQDISERLATLLTESSARRTTVDNLETGLSALTNNLVELNQSFTALAARTAALENTGSQSCTPAYVCQTINDAVAGTNQAMQITLGTMGQSVAQLGARLTALEAAAPIPVTATFTDIANAAQQAAAIRATAPAPFTPPHLGIAPVAAAPVHNHGAAAFLGGGATFGAHP
jgi:hypothetical protein